MKEDQARQEGRATGAACRKAGGQPGHKGASRAHNPEARRHHNFPGRRAPRCTGCGAATSLGSRIVRDIVDITITAAEMCHVIQTAECGRCGSCMPTPLTR